MRDEFGFFGHKNISSDSCKRLFHDQNERKKITIIIEVSRFLQKKLALLRLAKFGIKLIHLMHSCEFKGETQKEMSTRI